MDSRRLYRTLTLQQGQSGTIKNGGDSISRQPPQTPYGVQPSIKPYESFLRVPGAGLDQHGQQQPGEVPPSRVGSRALPPGSDWEEEKLSDDDEEENNLAEAGGTSLLCRVCRSKRMSRSSLGYCSNCCWRRRNRLRSFIPGLTPIFSILAFLIIMIILAIRRLSDDSTPPVRAYGTYLASLTAIFLIWLSIRWIWVNAVAFHVLRENPYVLALNAVLDPSIFYLFAAITNCLFWAYIPVIDFVPIAKWLQIRRLRNGPRNDLAVLLKANLFLILWTARDVLIGALSFKFLTKFLMNFNDTLVKYLVYYRYLRKFNLAWIALSAKVSHLFFLNEMGVLRETALFSRPTRMEGSVNESEQMRRLTLQEALEEVARGESYGSTLPQPLTRRSIEKTKVDSVANLLSIEYCRQVLPHIVVRGERVEIDSNKTAKYVGQTIFEDVIRLRNKLAPFGISVEQKDKMAVDILKDLLSIAQNTSPSSYVKKTPAKPTIGLGAVRRGPRRLSLRRKKGLPLSELKGVTGQGEGVVAPTLQNGEEDADVAQLLKPPRPKTPWLPPPSRKQLSKSDSVSGIPNSFDELFDAAQYKLAPDAIHKAAPPGSTLSSENSSFQQDGFDDEGSYSLGNVRLGSPYWRPLSHEDLGPLLEKGFMECQGDRSQFDSDEEREAERAVLSGEVLLSDDDDDDKPVSDCKNEFEGVDAGLSVEAALLDPWDYDDGPLSDFEEPLSDDDDDDADRERKRKIKWDVLSCVEPVVGAPNPCDSLQPNRSFSIKMQDAVSYVFLEYLMGNQIDEFLKLADKSGRRSVTVRGFTRMVTEVYKARKQLVHLIASQESLRKIVGRTVSLVLSLLFILIFLLVIGVSADTIIISGAALVSSCTVILSFLYTGFVQAIIFSCFLNPYNVGDRCRIDNKIVNVRKIHMYFTEYHSMLNVPELLNHTVLFEKPFINESRNRNAGLEIPVRFAYSVPQSKADALHFQVQHFVETHQEFVKNSFFCLMNDGLVENYIQYTYWLNTVDSWTDWKTVYQQRQLLYRFIQQQCKVLGITLTTTIYPFEVVPPEPNLAIKP